ncbi:MAG: hypothetical protein VKK03_01985 [Synechococcus sp.]|nr:hypothetical protein [Synechococcus sp.]
MTVRTPVTLLKDRIKRDPAFANGLHRMQSTTEASRFCAKHGLEIEPSMLWTQRGTLFSDGRPTWRG